jgi:hypothetical protein
LAIMSNGPRPRLGPVRRRSFEAPRRPRGSTYGDRDCAADRAAGAASRADDGRIPCRE